MHCALHNIIILMTSNIIPVKITAIILFNALTIETRNSICFFTYTHL